MNTPVSFPLAKQLKGKGFSQSFGNGQKFYYPPTKELTENHRGDNYAAPTIAEVVMWLYEKHGIWIRVDCNSKESWSPILVNIEDGGYKVHPHYVSQKFIEKNNRLFNSPIEAYEAAIEYTLNYLI